MTVHLMSSILNLFGNDVMLINALGISQGAPPKIGAALILR